MVEEKKAAVISFEFNKNIGITKLRVRKIDPIDGQALENVSKIIATIMKQRFDKNIAQDFFVNKLTAEGFNDFTFNCTGEGDFECEAQMRLLATAVSTYFAD